MEFITFDAAMRSQPTVLARLRDRLTDELRRFPAEIAPWRRGDTVALLAMGAAHHSTRALARVLREAGIRVLDVPASEVVSPEGIAPADHALIVSESGRSPEPIGAARRFPVGHRLVITNVPDAPVRQVADAVIDLGGFDDSRAYTAGYTATLLAFDALMHALVPAEAERTPDAGRGSVADAVADALQAFGGPAEDCASSLAEATAVDVVGSGISASSAAEIALLVRECLRIPATAFETQQYLHGPMESVREGTTVIVVGDGRERAIPRSLDGSGARFIVIGRNTASDAPQFDVGDRTGFARAAAEVVAGQHLMAAAIRRLPFAIEEFVHSQTDTKV
ncbi:SIS domain-containing protein [Humibacter albus]|uniref:SIS domain-containing protein n=1 Tax=Humibacter albus TaxID=427754 RepID=UPI0003B401AF|nr:SIS domain-containing protein [Humibacter albus]